MELRDDTGKFSIAAVSDDDGEYDDEDGEDDNDGDAGITTVFPYDYDSSIFVLSNLPLHHDTSTGIFIKLFFFMFRTLS